MFWAVGGSQKVSLQVHTERPQDANGFELLTSFL